MIWWYWIFLGLILLAADLITPGGFYMFFFGVAALAVGALQGLHIIESEMAQGLLFSVLSVVSLLLFRGPLMARLKFFEGHDNEVDGLVGEVAVVQEAIAPGGVGKAELRGSTWNACNTGATALVKGQRASVERVDGLTLSIKADP